jgi:hypothetical protein
MRYLAAVVLIVIAVPAFALSADTEKLTGYNHVPAIPWERPAVVLYDNGPLVTCAGCGSGGADASEVQTALGLGIYGFGHQVLNGFLVADDFTVTDAEWLVNSVNTFAYQSGSTTTSTITGVFITFYDGPPGAGGVPVFGDYTTNVITDTQWSGIYRVLDTDILGTVRPVMVQENSVGNCFQQGTYWMGWQSDGTLGSGPWVPPVSVSGSPGGPPANGEQSLDMGGTWAPLDDGGFSQDLPFILNGETTCGTIPTETATWGSLKATFAE